MTSFVKSSASSQDATVSANPLRELTRLGQSIWLDYIRRDLISTGELARLIREDGLSGMTSNPAIFEKAIAESQEYRGALREISRKPGLDAKGIYEQIAITDVQNAADVLRTVYDATKGRDGFVSLEVSPHLAHKTQETLEEARRLWNAVARENLMIKVPGTPEGIPAIRQLISEGININVTLLFAQDVYERVVEAFIAGLEELRQRGGNIRKVASVASFFVSRIDTVVDSELQGRAKSAKTPSEQALLRSLQGKAAIANAKLTYERYKQIFSGPRWQALASLGAQTQRVLWASTSTKNPAYRDVIYVEELIGPDTVNTIPPATFDAFRDHGKPRASLEENIEEARATMENLARAEISMKAVTDKLTEDGVKLFEDAFDKLMAAVDRQRGELAAPASNGFSYSLPADLTKAVELVLADWKTRNKVKRLWDRDSSLWTNSDENKWLGWLDIAKEQAATVDEFRRLAEEVHKAGFTQAVLLGMGGSSLCVEVLKLTFGKVPGFPEVLVLDSTDPAQVRSVERSLDLKKTIFIVSSKSGSTLEPNVFKQYFYERVKQVVGATEVGKRFIAITDPGSQMQQVAEKDGFRHIFFGLPSIGGRFSALSNFGIIPGAIQGLDVSKLLAHATQMMRACSADVAADGNPGVVLGAILGTLGKMGRDKVTIITSPGIADLGAWLEQLIAESTGKEGKGLIPVDRESLGSPDVYGQDRVFVYLRLETAPDPLQDAAVTAPEKAGQPVVRIAVPDAYGVGGEFFRWEIATAVAGAVLGINPFNQPDVEASKVETRKLTSEYEKTGSLPAESPFYSEDGIKLFTDAGNVEVLKQRAGGDATLAGYLRAHLSRIQAGDYFALLAYIEMSEAHERLLQTIRHAVRDKKHVATCVGFGPRFLHSTGQAYKGGPNTGIFLQITCDDAADLPVPGQKYTFGVVKAAQARGDFQVLVERKRRALRIHLGPDVLSGLKTLNEAIRKALLS